MEIAQIPITYTKTLTREGILTTPEGEPFIGHTIQNLHRTVITCIRVADIHGQPYTDEYGDSEEPETFVISTMHQNKPTMFILSYTAPLIRALKGAHEGDIVVLKTGVAMKLVSIDGKMPEEAFQDFCQSHSLE